MAEVEHHGNLHSRIVGWLKIILPLLALAILSTLFLISRTINPSDAIPFSEVDVADRLREPRMTQPTYSGVTSDGTSIRIYADEARPDAKAGTSPWANGLRADLYTPDGAVITLTAPKAVMDTEAGILHLTGGVNVVTSSDYAIATEALAATIDQTRLESDGPVRATSPMGRIDAGLMTITEKSDQPGTYVLVFQNRVKLIYQPQH
ncbi:MAG: LPS export ABC transporter periplasmic protein LptC [Paracoccaceae bacterium]|nr:LPS export ABC transporter periplasmic protein LptC [Paracoccaceae bacterium]